MWEKNIGEYHPSRKASRKKINSSYDLKIILGKSDRKINKECLLFKAFKDRLQTQKFHC